MKGERIRRRRQISSTPNTDKLQELVESGALDMRYNESELNRFRLALDAWQKNPKQDHQHSYIPIAWEYYAWHPNKEEWVHAAWDFYTYDKKVITKLYCTTCEETKEL